MSGHSFQCQCLSLGVCGLKIFGLSTWLISRYQPFTQRGLSESSLQCSSSCCLSCRDWKPFSFLFVNWVLLPVLKSVKGKEKNKKLQGFIEIWHSLLEWRQNIQKFEVNSLYQQIFSPFIAWVTMPFSQQKAEKVLPGKRVSWKSLL